MQIDSAPCYIQRALYTANAYDNYMWPLSLKCGNQNLQVIILKCDLQLYEHVHVSSTRAHPTETSMSRPITYTLARKQAYTRVLSPYN